MLIRSRSSQEPLLRGSYTEDGQTKSYLVVKEPDDIKTTVAYDLIGAGGFGIVIGDEWFHYKKGVLRKDSLKLLNRTPGFVKIFIGFATEENIKHYNSILGETWTITRNCETRLVRPWMMKN